jgi:peptide deformylase
MAKLKILKKGDPTLRRTCRPVAEITPRILTLIDDMTETMRDANGAGLAASQVGVLRRIVVIETPESGLVELINPEIIHSEGVQEATEGCLSIPGEWGITRRPAKVTVRALNRRGESIELSGTDLLARAFCHEIDHLNGRLFTDEGILVEKLEPEEHEKN